MTLPRRERWHSKTLVWNAMSARSTPIAVDNVRVRDGMPLLDEIYMSVNRIRIKFGGYLDGDERNLLALLDKIK